MSLERFFFFNFFFQVYGSNFNVEMFSGMGIYVMNRNVMIKLLKEYFPKANNLKNEVIPGAISLGLKVSFFFFFFEISNFKQIKIRKFNR